MKPVSIDSIRQRKVELEAKVSAIITANQTLLDTAENEKRDLTAAEADTFLKNAEGMKPLKPALGREDFILTEVAAQLERERNIGAAIQITDDGGRGDKNAKQNSRKLWAKRFAQQLQAVARAERTGQVDPRLTGIFGDFDAQGVFQAAGGSDGALNESVPSEGGFLVGADT